MWHELENACESSYALVKTNCVQRWAHISSGLPRNRVPSDIHPTQLVYLMKGCFLHQLERGGVYLTALPLNWSTLWRDVFSTSWKGAGYLTALPLRWPTLWRDVFSTSWKGAGSIWQPSHSITIDSWSCSQATCCKKRKY